MLKIFFSFFCLYFFFQIQESNGGATPECLSTCKPLNSTPPFRTKEFCEELCNPEVIKTAKNQCERLGLMCSVKDCTNSGRGVPPAIQNQNAYLNCLYQCINQNRDEPACKKLREEQQQKEQQQPQSQPTQEEQLQNKSQEEHPRKLKTNTQGQPQTARQSQPENEPPKEHEAEPQEESEEEPEEEQKEPEKNDKQIQYQIKKGTGKQKQAQIQKQ